MKPTDWKDADLDMIKILKYVRNQDIAEHSTSVEDRYTVYRLLFRSGIELMLRTSKVGEKDEMNTMFMYNTEEENTMLSAFLHKLASKIHPVEKDLLMYVKVMAVSECMETQVKKVLDLIENTK